MRTTYVNNASPAFRFAAFRRDAALGFPPSFVAIFAREPSDATSITQAPFRFSTLFRPCRCIAVRPPCLVATTEGGKRILQAKNQQPRSERSTDHATIRHQTSARRSQVVSLVS